jgi:hypothetical protein
VAQPLNHDISGMQSSQSTHKRPLTFQDTVAAAVCIDQNQKKRREHSLTGLHIDQTSDQASFVGLYDKELNIRPDVVLTKRLGRPQPNKTQPLLIYCFAYY